MSFNIIINESLLNFKYMGLTPHVVCIQNECYDIMVDYIIDQVKTSLEKNVYIQPIHNKEEKYTCLIISDKDIHKKVRIYIDSMIH